MTTIRQIVTDAYREANLVGLGETPDADKLDEGVRRLESLYDGMFGNELGDPLTTVNYRTSGLPNRYADSHDRAAEISSVYVPANIRLVLHLNTAETLYLHPNPDDGARFALIDNGANLATYNVTLNGNGRHIELADTVTLNTNSLNRQWFYRGDLGSWVRVSDLDVDDESPLPSEFDDLLSTLLAFRVNPRYGATTSLEMAEILKDARRKFRARYKQTTEKAVEDGLLRLSAHRRYGFGSFDRFDRGR